MKTPPIQTEPEVTPDKAGYAATASRMTLEPNHQQAPEKEWIAPTDCKKYDRCSANICPLDPDRHLRSHLNGERVCYYLTEAVKNHAQANFEGVRLGKLYETILPRIPDIISRHRPIKKALALAANSGSRMTRLLPKAGGVQ